MKFWNFFPKKHNNKTKTKQQQQQQQQQKCHIRQKRFGLVTAELNRQTPTLPCILYSVQSCRPVLPPPPSSPTSPHPWDISWGYDVHSPIMFLFLQLVQPDEEFSFQQFLNPANKYKNRYANIVACKCLQSPFASFSIAEWLEYFTTA